MVTTQKPRAITQRAALALGLFVVGFVLLCVGRFVQFSDVTGSGSGEWVLPLGYLAALAGVASVVAAWSEAKARLWLGCLMALLLVFLVWQVVANSAFRFVWAADEGELLMFQVALGVVALALIATGLQPPRKAEGAASTGRGRWLVRAVIYLAATLLTAYVMYLIGTDYYQRTDCPDLETDCLAPVGGFIWGLLSVPVCLVAVVVIELVLRNRRQQCVS